MTWRDQLQPGSFRGVPFHVDETEGKLGRRQHLHEYPLQEEPWAEDLGRKAREFTLQVFVVGSNYHQVRDRLIQAIEQTGPGTLIHPRLGAMRVSMTANCRWKESTREGGMAEFTLAYVQSGDRKFPATQTDTASAVKTSVNAGLTALQTDVNQRFTTAKKPQFVAADALATVRTGLGAVNKSISAYNAARRYNVMGVINALDIQLPTLVKDAWQLAGQIINTQREVFTLFAHGDNHVGPATAEASGATSVLEPPLSTPGRISDSLANLSAVPATTPTRRTQADNRASLTHLFTVSATLLAAQAVVELSPGVGVQSNTQSPFDSYNHALQVRDQLMSQLDAVATTASDPVYRAVRDVQAQLRRHIDAHGYRLERIAYHTPAVELPSLVLAHQLTGSADKGADIVRRNKVRHPGFVPAGKPLEVLREVPNG